MWKCLLKPSFYICMTFTSRDYLPGWPFQPFLSNFNCFYNFGANFRGVSSARSWGPWLYINTNNLNIYYGNVLNWQWNIVYDDLHDFHDKHEIYMSIYEILSALLFEFRHSFFFAINSYRLIYDLFLFFLFFFFINLLIY